MYDRGFRINHRISKQERSWRSALVRTLFSENQGFPRQGFLFRPYLPARHLVHSCLNNRRTILVWRRRAQRNTQARHARSPRLSQWKNRMPLKSPSRKPTGQYQCAIALRVVSPSNGVALRYGALIGYPRSVDRISGPPRRAEGCWYPRLLLR